MAGITTLKRWALLTLCAVVVLPALLAFIPTSPAKAAGNGTIKGGKYTFDVKGTAVPIDNENTKVVLAPAPAGTTTTIDDGNLTIDNVPEGTYSVTVNSKFDQKLCGRNTVTKILAFATPAFLAFCAGTGVGTTYYSSQKIFSNVVVKGGETTTLSPANGSLGVTTQVDENGNPVLSCSGKGVLMPFVICPLIEYSLGIIEWIVSNFIQPFLSINPLSTTNDDGSQSEIYTIWNNLRNLANVLFIVIFFVIIFSQTTSVGISNYGIKRLLPRLILIGIGANVSFFVCAFFIDLFNILGVGIGSLMVSGITNGSLNINLSGGDFIGSLGIASLLTPIGPLVAAATSGIIFFIFLFTGATVFLLFFAAVVILIRQVVLIFLVMVSPLAFMAGLLPNTQKYFTGWFTTYLRLLAMYPLIMVFTAAGKILGVVFQKMGG